jgi:predicted phosphodiesterase
MQHLAVAPERFTGGTTLMSASRLITLVAALSLIIASCGKDSSGPPPISPPVPPPPPPAAPPVILMAAANVTGCTVDNDDQTAAVIMKDTAAAVLALGDMTQSGNLKDFQDCYNPSWGQFKARTYPVIGNHEYGMNYDRTTLDSTFAYFGDRIPAAGRPHGYYSFELGKWHVIVLNDNWDKLGGRIDLADSTQMAWLATDLAAAKNKCVMAAFHQPTFFSSPIAGYTQRAGAARVFDVLAKAGVDVVVNGHQHQYERMSPMNGDGTKNDSTGLRQFNVGTGGESLYLESSVTEIHPNSAVRIFKYGVVRFSLDSTSYQWSFLPDDGTPAADTGSGVCH